MILPMLKEGMTRGETYPDVKAIVHKGGCTLSVEVNITGQGMDVSTATNRLDNSLNLIRKVMNGGLMNALQEAAGNNLHLGKFTVLQGQHPWLVNVGTLLSVRVDDPPVVAEALKPFIKRQLLEYR